MSGRLPDLQEVAPTQYDGYSELVKAGTRRLKDAQELLEQPSLDPHASDAPFRRLIGARYLAGYAVECILKAYIIQCQGAKRGNDIQRWSQIVEMDGLPDLTGRKSHNLLTLLAVADLHTQFGTDPVAREAWGVCCKWNYSIRYMPGQTIGGQRAAEPARTASFVDCCATIYAWVRNRLVVK